VIVYMENQSGDLGHDRQTIRADIIQERDVQQEIIKTLLHTHHKERLASKGRAQLQECKLHASTMGQQVCLFVEHHIACFE